MKTSLSFLSCLLILMASCLTISPGTVHSASLSDRDIRKIAEEKWNGKDNNTVKLPLGNYAVGGGMVDQIEEQPSNLKGRRLSPSYFRFLSGYAKIDIIFVSRDKKYDDFQKGKGFTWEDWNAALKGTTARVNITPTEKGLRLGKKERILDGAVEVLSITHSNKFEVTKVHKAEEKKIGADEFKVVHLSYNAEFDPVFMAAWTAAGKKKMANKRKGIVLFKHDPFKEKWNYVTGDFADAEDEFTTRNVDKILLRQH